MSNSKFDGSIIGAIETRIENGLQFETSSLLTVSNNGGVAKWLITTGDKTIIVNNRQLTTNGNELTYQAFEDSEISSQGTEITEITNRNGYSNNKPTLKLFASPTETAQGKPIPAVYMPGTSLSGNKTADQFSSDGLVRILKQNTNYLLTLTNNGTENNANVQLYLLWAELNDPRPFQR